MQSVVAAAFAATLAIHGSAAEEATTVATLAKQTHFHGIAADPRNASRIYLATHHGLFRVSPDGSAVLVSNTRDDFMGFTPHPSDPATLYASGHPATGGNLGFLASKDGGKSWTKLSNGIGGPVDFHQMDVSKADPMVIYGVYRDLQRSNDGGRTWQRIGPPPEDLIALAASSLSPDTLYAATQRGLLRSTDGGKSWDIAHIIRRPATMVYVTPGGEIYAFMVGTGLLQASEKDLQWRTLSSGWGNAYVLHLAAGPQNGRSLYAVTFDPASKSQAVRASADGGRSWKPIGEGGPHRGNGG